MAFLRNCALTCFSRCLRPKASRARDWGCGSSVKFCGNIMGTFACAAATEEHGPAHASASPFRWDNQDKTFAPQRHGESKRSKKLLPQNLPSMNKMRG